MHTKPESESRIAMIDALRGLALSGILLLHHIEHFDFYKKPLKEFRFEWLKPLDSWVWDNLFLIASGKAYALFSILFGLSFAIISQNARNRGEPYLFRHFWRMALLVGFGLFHMLFFRGDILIMYAILGLPLAFTLFMSNRAILIVAFILLLNPINLYAIATYFIGPEVYNFNLSYPKQGMNKFLSGDSFIELVKANFLYGYPTTLIWSWNVGRMLSIPGLFFLGVYLGRTKSLTDRPLSFWYRFFYSSLVVCIATYILRDAFVSQIVEDQNRKILEAIADIYIRLSSTFFILSAFVILWRLHDGRIWVNKLCNFGRMGLTNYILMSVIGAVLYYGWAAGLYRYCGTTLSFIIGLAALYAQMQFSNYWIAKYGQGPLESLWRKGTWMRFNLSKAKQSESPEPAGSS